MSHQKGCYRLGVVSCSSYPSGDRMCPLALVGVSEVKLRHYDRVAVHATPQRLSTTAKTGPNKTEYVQS